MKKARLSPGETECISAFLKRGGKIGIYPPGYVPPARLKREFGKSGFNKYYANGPKQKPVFVSAR
jgi:hypothetical protein